MNVDDEIARCELWHVGIPVHRPRDHGSGLVSGTVEVVLLRVESADGAMGWGEGSPWAVFTGTPEATFAALQRYILPSAVGQPVAAIPAIMAGADRAVVGHPEAKAALETALLDCVGRLSGVPVWALLGGRHRKRIPLSVSLADPDFDHDLELVARLVDDGVGIVKLKTGAKDHKFDLMRLERLRRDFESLDIRVDYNQGMAPFEALGRLRDIEAFDVTFIEQPVPGGERTALASLTRALDTPVLADESAFDPREVFEAARDRICDCVSVKIMKCGGPRRGLEMAAIAGAAGLPAYGGDMFETGVAHLAGTHMIAAAPNVSLGCEFYQAKYYLAEDVLVDAFPILDGQVVVPDGPGLGIDVDRVVVDKHTIRHASVGP